MPRGIRKRGEFDFTIWFADGSRVQWASSRTQTDAGIAAAIRRYLLPVAERIEARAGEAEHVCGLAGYNGMIDPPCPACEAVAKAEGRA